MGVDDQLARSERKAQRQDIRHQVRSKSRLIEVSRPTGLATVSPRSVGLASPGGVGVVNLIRDAERSRTSTLSDRRTLDQAERMLSQPRVHDLHPVRRPARIIRHPPTRYLRRGAAC